MSTGAQVVWLVDLLSKQEIGFIKGYSGMGNAIMFSPDGNNLIVHGTTRSIFVFGNPSLAEIDAVEKTQTAIR